MHCSKRFSSCSGSCYGFCAGIGGLEPGIVLEDVRVGMVLFPFLSELYSLVWELFAFRMPLQKKTSASQRIYHEGRIRTGITLRN